MLQHADLNIEERAEVAVSLEAFTDLVEWYQCGDESRAGMSPPLALGHDMRAKFGDEGFPLWRDLMFVYEPPLLADQLMPGDMRKAYTVEEYEAALVDQWSRLDRPRHWIDTLIIDAMSRAKSDGWEICAPEEISASTETILDDLARRSGAKRAALAGDSAAADERSWARAEKCYRLDDAAYAAWVLAGEPEGRARKFARWKSRRERDRSAAIRNIPLAPGTPMPAKNAASLPMLAGSQAVVDEGLPIISGFNALHSATVTDAPQLPPTMYVAPLREPLQAAVDRMVARAETQRAAFKVGDVLEVLAVLAAAHKPTFDATVIRMRNSGAVLPDGKLHNAIGAFEAQVQRTARTGQGWILDSKGRPDPWISENVEVFLSRENIELRFNVFARQKEFSRKRQPWQLLSDDDVRAISHEARSINHQFNVSKSHLAESLTTIARRRAYDPPMDYVDSLQWDGVKRLDTWLSKACGVVDDAYHRAVARNVIGGLVRRIRHPGCKHDTTLLLISALQGTGKSSLARYLVPNESWFDDHFDPKLSPQNLLPTLDGKLIIEWAEMASMRRSDVEDVKAFLTRQNDNYTKKYDSTASNHPRRFIFIATSNDASPLRDDTGNRRFLPIHVVGMINLDWVRENRDMLVAEASILEAAGEDFAIPPDVWASAAQHQQAARATTPAEDLLLDWFGGTGGRFWISSSDITEALRHHGVRSSRNVGSACERVGLRDVRFRFDGRPQARAWATDGTTEADHRVRLSLEGGMVKWKWPAFSQTHALPNVPSASIAPPPC